MKYGVGYGQKGGGWLNQHFADRASAEAFFDQELERTKVAFSRSWNGKYVVADIGNHVLIRGTAVQNIKKDGKLGKVVFRLHLYALPAQAAA